jgi:hypothetical protein
MDKVKGGAETPSGTSGEQLRSPHLWVLAAGEAFAPILYSLRMNHGHWFQPLSRGSATNR